MFTKHQESHETCFAVLLRIQIQMVLEVCQAVTLFVCHISSTMTNWLRLNVCQL